MKKCLLALMFLSGSWAFQSVFAQIRACIFCNVVDQPAWGPAGYEFAYYYYIPEIDIYYYVPQHLFVYQRRGDWVSSSNPAAAVCRIRSV